MIKTYSSTDTCTIMRTKIAVIGLGNMGRHHVKHVSAIDEAELIAVCDPSEDKARLFSQQYACKSYTYINRLLESEKLDAVIITAPTSLHFELAKISLEHGVSVLVEKPICETVEEASELINVAKKKNLTLMVGHIERFNPAIQKAKELIDANHLGNIKIISARRAGRFPSQMKDANVVIDLAVHDIDILSYLIGEFPNEVIGKAGNALVTERPDLASILLTYPGGSQGFIHVNWITPSPFRTLQITGTKGHIELDYASKETWFYPSVYTCSKNDSGFDSISFVDEPRRKVNITPVDQLHAEISHFIDCVINKKNPVIDGISGRNALETSLKILSQF